MTISEPNPDVKPTGEEAGEFLEPPEPHPATPPAPSRASGSSSDATAEPVRTHPDARDVGERDSEDGGPPLADGSADDRDEVMDAT